MTANFFFDRASDGKLFPSTSIEQMKKPDIILKEYFNTREELLEKVRQLGLEIREPADDELFIDIDSDSGWQQCRKAVERINDVLHYDGKLSRVRITNATWSRSGPPHRHVVVKWHRPLAVVDKKLLSTRRAGLEMAFGSDPKRGLNEFDDIWWERPCPSIFMEEPGWEKKICQDWWEDKP